MLVLNSTQPADLTAWSQTLVRMDAHLDEHARAELLALAYGRSLGELAKVVQTAADPAAIRSAAELLAANEGGCSCSGDAPPEPTAAQLEAAADRLTREAITPFMCNHSLREYLALLGCRVELPADT